MITSLWEGIAGCFAYCKIIEDNYRIKYFYLKVNYEGILLYEILMDCVARKLCCKEKNAENYIQLF